MLIKVSAFSALAALVFCVDTFAAPQPEKQAAVIQTAFQYANASGCADVAPSASHIAPFAASGHPSGDAFIVLVDVDKDCAHTGDAWETSIYVTARPQGNFASDDPKGIKVVPDMSAPVARRKGGPRILTAIEAKGGNIYVTGATFGSNDRPCCPSVKSRFKLTLQEHHLKVGKDDDVTVYRWILTPAK